MVYYPDSKVHGANMGSIWGREDPSGPHVGPINFAIWGAYNWSILKIPHALIFIPMIQSCLTFTHDMTVELSWHMQDCDQSQYGMCKIETDLFNIFEQKTKNIM